LTHRFLVQDRLFFGLVLVLALFGLVMVYSASSVIALDRYADSWFYFKRQAVFILGGFFCMGLALATDYHRWIRSGGYILGAAILMLIAVHIPGIGVKAGGAQRWLSMGGMRFQPAEFTKIACVIYMAWALVRKGDNVRSFTYGLLPMGLVAGLLVGLLMLQPDFGNAMVLLFVSGVMLFLAGGRVAYLLGAAAVCAPIAWALVMGAEYRRRRLLAFLDPWADPQNTSYQIVQSFTAFFSGGWWGQGLGNGQEKLHYLPEVHTDFIAAVVGEELGFVAVILMILAFLLLLYRGYRIAMNASDRSGFLLAAGCTTLIGLQVVLNLGVVMGLLPTKGMPLPFISHGGSSILMSFLACGLILSVAKKGAISSREAGEI
jgi:cell division protein FtsW